MVEREEGPEITGIIAIALGVIAWVSFLLAFFMADDPFWFLAFALVCGGIALAIGVRARREEAAAGAIGGAAAGAALLWGVSVVAALTAMVYAMGVLMLLVLIFFFAVMFGASSASSSSSGGCGCGGGSGGGGGCCCEDCCDDCGSSACDCGCASCCDCGECDCGGCGGCGCIGFGMVLPAMRAERTATQRNRFAHHPDTPEFAADVYLVRGIRYCIGCFTTYPVFLAASALLIAFTPPSAPAILAGLALALVQGVSSAGLAKARWMKVAVKTCLGLGLALMVSGIHSAAWLPQLKVAALLALLGLAWLSAVPRARRMKKARPACVHRHEDIAHDVATPAPR